MLDSHYTLEKCAEVIVNGGELPKHVDLALVWMGFKNELYKEMAALLAKQVEEISEGKYTIRQADASLYKNKPHWSLLRIVRCPRDTPEGVVSTLGEDMMLIELGPQNYLFQTNVAAATSK